MVVITWITHLSLTRNSAHRYRVEETQPTSGGLLIVVVLSLLNEGLYRLRGAENSVEDRKQDNCGSSSLQPALTHLS